MTSYTIGLLAGIAAVLAIGAIAKIRRRKMPMSVAEKAEYLSKRRARMLPALAAIFLAASGVWQTSPAGTETPYWASNCLAWYS